MLLSSEQSKNQRRWRCGRWTPQPIKVCNKLCLSPNVRCCRKLWTRARHGCTRPQMKKCTAKRSLLSKKPKLNYSADRLTRMKVVSGSSVGSKLPPFSFSKRAHARIVVQNQMYCHCGKNASSFANSSFFKQQTRIRYSSKELCFCMYTSEIWRNAYGLAS